MSKTRNFKIKKKKPLRRVLNRKIARNILKNRNGNNKIQESWQKCQIQKYQGKVAEYLKDRAEENRNAKKFDNSTLLKFIRSFMKRKKAA